MSVAPTPLRRTSTPALIAGALVYAGAKMAAIGLLTGVGPAQIAASRDLILPIALSQGVSELLAVALVLVFVVGFTRISPRSAFLCAALVQAALGVFAPMEWKDTWMRWMFGAVGLDQVWSHLGLSPPFGAHGPFSGVSLISLAVCAAAGAVAQAAHNRVAGGRAGPEGAALR
ncbi:MAG: hypothetical protein K1X35_12550 [Caulobacteraceae bacterium]|nr:hypothetical protein [Caulobacteraceae bacterium]